MAPRQTDPQYKLRLTPSLKAALDDAARANNRSLNSEILARLEQSLRFDMDGPLGVGAGEVAVVEEIRALRHTLANIRWVTDPQTKDGILRGHALARPEDD